MIEENKQIQKYKFTCVHGERVKEDEEKMGEGERVLIWDTVLSLDQTLTGVVWGLSQLGREGIVLILNLAGEAWQRLTKSMSWEVEISGFSSYAHC